MKPRAITLVKDTLKDTKPKVEDKVEDKSTRFIAYVLHKPNKVKQNSKEVIKKTGEKGKEKIVPTLKII